jgi:hypothetical protein
MGVPKTKEKGRKDYSTNGLFAFKVQLPDLQPVGWVQPAEGALQTIDCGRT